MLTTKITSRGRLKQTALSPDVGEPPAARGLAGAVRRRHGLTRNENSNRVSSFNLKNIFRENHAVTIFLGGSRQSELTAHDARKNVKKVFFRFYVQRR